MATTLPALPAPATPDIYEKSAETMRWLRENILIGYTTERGPAWWADGALTKDGTWEGIPDGSHFEGPVPMEEVTRLLDVRLVKGKVHIEYEDENGQRQVTSDEDTPPIVNARTGQVFGYPTDSYAIHPYLDTLSGFICKILFDETVGVGSAGLLQRGGVAFLQAVLPEDFEVAGYGFQPYISAVTSANQRRSTSFSTGAKGMVCDTTVNMALREALTMLKIKHTGNSMPKVNDAREKLGIQLAVVGESIADSIESLLKIEVSDAEFRRWLDLDTPLPEKNEKFTTGGRGYTMAEEKREEKTRLWREDPKVAPWSGTGFGILQLDNTYRTWGGITRNMPGGQLERNFTSVMLGKTAQADERALTLLAQVKERRIAVT